MADYKAEGKIVMPEMANALKQSEPVALLKEVHQLLKEVQSLQQKQQEGIKTNLRQFMQIVDDKEQNGELMKKEIQEADAENELGEKKRAEETERNKAILQEYEACMIAIEEKTEEEKKLQDYRKQVTESTTSTLPQTRFKVNLFQKILGIQWDYESDPNEIKGYVCTKHDARPFCLHKQQNSDFFITNHLWDLVEAAHME